MKSLSNPHFPRDFAIFPWFSPFPPRLRHLFPNQLCRPRGIVIRGLGVGGTVRGGAQPRAFQDTSGWKTIGKCKEIKELRFEWDTSNVYINLKTCIYKGFSFYGYKAV